MDATTDFDLGDPVPTKKGRGKRSGPTPLPTKSPKVVPLRRPKPKLVEDPELEAQEAKDQPGRNASGEIEHEDKLYRAILAEKHSYERLSAQLKGKYSAKVKAFKQAGGDIKLLNETGRELTNSSDENAAKENKRARIRAYFDLPHGPPVPIPSMNLRTDTQREKHAEMEGRLCRWRPGREQDNPYPPEDQIRHQAFIRGYREADALLASSGASAAALKLF